MSPPRGETLSTVTVSEASWPAQTGATVSANSTPRIVHVRHQKRFNTEIAEKVIRRAKRARSPLRVLRVESFCPQTDAAILAVRRASVRVFCRLRSGLSPTRRIWREAHARRL